MNINFSPVSMDQQLTLSREGDKIYANGELFDFGPLLEGATLPASAIASIWFSGQVDRIEGELHLTIRLPHGANAPYSTRFPAPIVVTGNGPIELPIYDLPADSAMGGESGGLERPEGLAGESSEEVAVRAE